MKKKILITGSTDGIGLATAKTLLEQGHHVLLHGRNEAKLAATKQELSKQNGDANIETYSADLSSFQQVVTLADEIFENHEHLDVLINNAGVFSANKKTTDDGLGLDVRFAVNTIAPYLLTRKLMPLLSNAGRVINLSSAAQAPLGSADLTKLTNLTDNAAYAQSKLALTMWSRHVALTQDAEGPVVVAVNPASMLGSNMVKEAYGVTGGDIQIGADILVRAALSDEFANASGLYFDNDIGKFSAPHPDALDTNKIAELTKKLDEIIAGYL